MYPLGHMALGYFAGKLVTNYTKRDSNLILLFIMSILPDVDMILPNVIHRGLTHSTVLTIIFAVPLLLYNKETLPYLAALLTHSLVGDYFTSYGCKLLWPLSNNFIVYRRAWPVGSTLGIVVELVLFTTMLMMISFPIIQARKQLKI